MFTNTESAFLHFTNVNPECEGLHKDLQGFQLSFDINQKQIHLDKGENIQEDKYKFPDKDALPDDADLGDGEPSISLGPLSLASDSSEPLEENSDPYMVKSLSAVNDQISEVLPHLLVVYVMVTWLHFQFHLPCVVCNMLLAFLGILIRFFKLAIALMIQTHTYTCKVEAKPGPWVLSQSAT